MNRILLLLIVITLNTAYAWAKWAPTWSSGERWSHVLYHDNSTNCESNLSNFPKFMDSTEDPKGNGFSYYITESKNSKANPGSFDVVYVITDAITLREGVKYTLQFDAKTYNDEEDDAKLSIGLLTDADPTATTISQTICEFEKYTPGGNDYKTETVEFTSQVSGTYYLRLNLAFTLKKATYVADFSNFVITADVKSAVNINSSTHGKVESSSSLAQADEQVSITPIPDEGYYLQSISVVGTESGNVVNISGGTFFSPVATFSMPEEAVTVTVEFAKELTAENVSVNMLANGSQEFTLPTVIKSLKIYDNGGKLGGYSSNCNGLFTLNAPSGCRLRFSGSSYFENRWDKLTIFDGTEDGQKLFDSNDLSSSQQDIPTLTTTSNKLTLKITSDGGVEYDGLDLTVTVVGHELTLPQGIVIAEDAEKVDGTYMPGAELTIKADDNYSLSDVKANDETITANTDGTYAITFGGENIEVTAVVKKSLKHADITVASVDDQTYTGSAIEPIVTVFDGDKDITSYCNISFSNNTNVGTAGISIAATAENERYVGSVDATFTISPKAVTVTANDKNVVYGETFDLTATVDGVVGSDEIAYTISREEGENVGEYVITPSGDELQGNYAVTYVAGKLTISPKSVTVTADDKTTAYGAAFTLTATVDGVLGSDEIAYTISREEGENVGEYVITPSGEKLQGNYAVTYVAGKYTILKATPEFEEIKSQVIESTQTLADVTLPEGYSFVNAEQTLNLGENTVALNYTPDPVNYETVSGNMLVIVTKATVTGVQDAQNAKSQSVKKYVENGSLIIEVDGVKYDITGKVVK